MKESDLKDDKEKWLRAGNVVINSNIILIKVKSFINV